MSVARDTLARVVRAREALADGDIDFAEAILEELEIDLAGAIEQDEAEAR